MAIAGLAALLTGLKYATVFVFMVIRDGLIMVRVKRLQAPDQLANVGFLPRFVVGLLVIFVNPKAFDFISGCCPDFLI